MLVKIKNFLIRSIILHLPIRELVLRQIRWEMHAIWADINNLFNPLYILRLKKIKRMDNLSVNVGCAATGKSGWINLDIRRYPLVTLIYNCRKGLPFRKDTVLRIRCEHFLEHLYHKEAPLFLRSCFLCLKKGGILRVIVPDAERFLMAYVSKRKEDWLSLGWDLDNLPKGFKTPMDVINFVFRQEEEHLYAYDFQTLELLLREAGFKKIYKTAFRVSVDPELCDDLASYYRHSLYVEAIKEI